MARDGRVRAPNGRRAADQSSGGQRSERRKWLSCFEGVSVLVFLVATSECASFAHLTSLIPSSRPAALCVGSGLITLLTKADEDESVNRLAESVTLFSSTINSPFFANTAVCVIGLVLALTSISILLLVRRPKPDRADRLQNKVDLFAAKLKTRRLGDYLKGYDGDNSFKSGLSAMRRLFERLRKPTGTSTITGQTLHTHATCATDTRTVRRCAPSASLTCSDPADLTRRARPDPTIAAQRRLSTIIGRRCASTFGRPGMLSWRPPSSRLVFLSPVYAQRLPLQPI